MVTIIKALHNSTILYYTSSSQSGLFNTLHLYAYISRHSSSTTRRPSFLGLVNGPSPPTFHGSS